MQPLSWATSHPVRCLMRRPFLAVALAIVTTGALLPGLSRAQVASASAPSPGRYTFTWPIDHPRLAPRGGTTRGAPVVLDTEPSPAWRALQESGLSAFERDRRAILAMAGIYRVSFDFLEVDSFKAGSSAPAPYQSWATEKVYVDRDEPGFISLVHILEMRIVAAGGAVGEPFVTKHWRQDWRFEPSTIVEYQGRDRWRMRALSQSERAGRSGRRPSIRSTNLPAMPASAAGSTTPSFSTWSSGETWRPLPRREWSVRDDYQVLIGTNRHTVAPTGWTQEENNLKAVLTPDRVVDPRRPFAGREYGFARYERLLPEGFAAADDYYGKTRAFWNRVAASLVDRFRSTRRDHPSRRERQARPVPALVRTGGKNPKWGAKPARHFRRRNRAVRRFASRELAAPDRAFAGYRCGPLEGNGTAVAPRTPSPFRAVIQRLFMNPAVRSDLLDSMGLVGRGLGVLQSSALRAGKGQEMATLEMRLAMLRARLQAGSAGPQLLAGVRLFVEDFENFVTELAVR